MEHLPTPPIRWIAETLTENIAMADDANSDSDGKGLAKRILEDAPIFLGRHGMDRDTNAIWAYLTIGEQEKAKMRAERLAYIHPRVCHPSLLKLRILTFLHHGDVKEAKHLALVFAQTAQDDDLQDLHWLIQLALGKRLLS